MMAPPLTRNLAKSLTALFVVAFNCGCQSDTLSPALVDAPLKKSISISVAASTTEVMETLAAQFTKEKGVIVKVNPGPSSGLAAQIVEGAPVDLFLSANREFAKAVEQAGLAGDSKELLTNRLALIAPKGNPAKIQKPEDLLFDQVKKIALAGEKVPAGKFADQALKNLQLYEKIEQAGKIARGQDVRNALQFVERGEAEAGIVYSTDVQGSDVQVVHEFDPSLHDEIVYVLVLLKQGDQNPSAKAFYEFVQSSAAKEVFAKAGFQPFGAKRE